MDAVGGGGGGGVTEHGWRDRSVLLSSDASLWASHQ